MLAVQVVIVVVSILLIVVYSTRVPFQYKCSHSFRCLAGMAAVLGRGWTSHA